MILVESTRNVINTDEVRRGTLIWAKHSSWDTGQCGMVTDVTEKKITVKYIPTIQNVLNHFIIYASELEAGAWQLRYSSDGLETVTEFGMDGGEADGS